MTLLHVTSPTASQRKQLAGAEAGAGPAVEVTSRGEGGGRGGCRSDQQGRGRPAVVGAGVGTTPTQGEARRAWGTRRRRKHTSRYAPLTSSPLSSLVTRAVGDGFQSDVLQHR